MKSKKLLMISIIASVFSFGVSQAAQVYLNYDNSDFTIHISKSGWRAGKTYSPISQSYIGELSGTYNIYADSLHWFKMHHPLVGTYSIPSNSNQCVELTVRGEWHEGSKPTITQTNISCPSNQKVQNFR